MHNRIFSLLVRPLAAALLLTGLVAFSGQALADDTRLSKASAVNCPTLKLKHWKNSSLEEKTAFLFGFATMLEIEREWQGDAPLAISSSITSAWSRGLAGVTLGQMRDTVDRYAAEHPDQLERSVIGVLGMHYIGPKLSAAEKDMAAQRYRQIREMRR